MVNPKPLNTFRVISRNVNTLSTKHGYLQWKAASQASTTSEADAISFQETNILWTKIHRRRISQIFRIPTDHTILATTSSSDLTNKSDQRGGTFQALVGPWVSRAVATGHDESGLGRWSYLELQGKEDKRYIILSGYRVCENQQVDMGSNNTYNQQYRLLHQKGHRNPDPRKQFVDDLIQAINKWRNQQKAVLICIDANDNPQSHSTQGITRIFTETDLVDLHSSRHPNQIRPPTYNRGSTPIDLCAGSIEFATALDRAWYLPFGLPVGLKGDHRTLGLDFNTDKLFNQQVAPMHKVPTRGVYSNNMKLVEQFCTQVVQECQNQGIHDRIQNITAKTTLTTSDHHNLDQLDADLTKILVNADRQCIKAGDSPWSPQLHKAYLVHHYWSLKLSQRKTGRNYPQAYSSIEAQVPYEQLHPNPTDTISANLRYAQKQLNELHRTAQEKRQTHLDELITAAAVCNDQRKKKLIIGLKRAEELRSCYALVRSVTKPRQHGGLSHVKIPNPDNTQWESIYEPKALEEQILKQHRKHFSQAAGTVFTSDPLRTLINDECTSEFAQQVLAGNADIESLPIDEYTKDLLHHLKTKIPPRKTQPIHSTPRKSFKDSKDGRRELPHHPPDDTLEFTSP